MNAITPPPLLKSTAVCGILQCSMSSLKKMRAEGTGPRYIRLGKSIRYSPEAVREFIEEQEASNGTTK